MTAHQQWMFSYPRANTPPGEQPPEGAVFLEQFIYADLAEAYSVISAGGAGFGLTLTPYANGPNGLRYTPRNGAQSAIQRVLGAPATFNTLEAKFRINVFGSNDSGIMELRNGPSTTAISLNPRRDHSVDANDPPYVAFATAETAIGSAALALDTWYRFRWEGTSGAGNSTVNITRVADDVLVATVHPAGDYPTFTFDRLRFKDDTGGDITGVDYDDIWAFNR